jgi:hypothetical protein
MRLRAFHMKDLFDRSFAEPRKFRENNEQVLFAIQKQLKAVL